MRRIFAFPLSLLIFCNPLYANSLTSLSEAMENGAEESYPLVRCAALNYAVFEYAGETVLGEEVSSATEQTITNLMILAATLRAEKGASAEMAPDQVLREVNAIKEIYLNRFKVNFAEQGQAFGSDAIVGADLDLCRIITGHMRERLSQ